ncbi:uncharacterized protein [Vicugna pacos]|uniref:Uncharacterized protein isoform X1 n=2 Tax=Vicugna pacos TaxID=30538 RepID=A0ABM5BQR7_VICPA
MLKLSIMAEIRRVGLQPGNSVLEERKDAQRQLSQEQNARVKEDEILAHHLSQQKEAEKANKKMNAEEEFSPGEWTPATSRASRSNSCLKPWLHRRATATADGGLLRDKSKAKRTTSTTNNNKNTPTSLDPALPVISPSP